MAINMAITVAMVAVIRLNLMANRISSDSSAETKEFQSVKASMDTIIPIKKIASRARALMVAPLKALSLPIPLKSLGIKYTPQ